MALVKKYGMMDLTMKEFLLKARNKVKAIIDGQMVVPMTESGLIMP